MQLTLRKANALQNSILDHVKTIGVNATITLNEFQNPEMELESARQTLIVNDNRRAKLQKALYEIRAQVGRANTQSGVADLLAQAAYIDKRLGQLKSLTEVDEAESLDVVKGKLRKMSESDAKSRIYGYNESITTGVLTADQVSSFKAEILTLKKEKQSINDRVLELNVRIEIVLQDDTVALLKAEGLI